MAVIPETVTMREAARILGVSNAKMWRLVKEGVLPAQPNPLDRREKLIRRHDLAHLRAQGQPRQQFISDGSDDAPVDVPAREIRDWLRETWNRDN